jgi:hypothetical protein
MSRWTLLCFTLLACAKSPQTTPDPSDADTDADTDSDTDADADADTDSDTDTDTEPRDTEHQVMFVGHSLIGWDMPTMAAQIADTLELTHSWDAQIINGSPLVFNWENGDGAEGVNARTNLATGAYDTLVITEAVPLVNHTTWSDTTTYAGLYYDLAMDSNPDSVVYLYETWHCIQSGTSVGCEWDDNDDVAWRTRLDTDLAAWQAIVDEVNATRSTTPMRLVLGGQAMAALHDAIEAGDVPGITAIDQVFHDDIHPNDLGSYYMALLQVTTLYGADPRGATRHTVDQWGEAFYAPTEAQAAVFQDLAWKVGSATD